MKINSIGHLVKTNPIKPNFRKAQMNVNSLITKDYRKNDIFAVPENKANSNPIKANLLDAQMNISSLSTKEYENETAFRLRQNKPNQTQFPKSPNECKLTYNKGL